MPIFSFLSSLHSTDFCTIPKGSFLLGALFPVHFLEVIRDFRKMTTRAIWRENAKKRECKGKRERGKKKGKFQIRKEKKKKKCMEVYGICKKGIMVLQ
jgi:hypothetical protein